MAIAAFSLGDIRIGQTASFETEVNAADLDRFAALTGDVNPLHMDSEFARRRGFEDRVVHGALLAGLVSRLVGVHLPGRDCLMHALQMKFNAPTRVGSRIRVTGVVDQVSEAARAVVLKVSIVDAASAAALASGKVNLGFTEDLRNG